MSYGGYMLKSKVERTGTRTKSEMYANETPKSIHQRFRFRPFFPRFSLLFLRSWHIPHRYFHQECRSITGLKTKLIECAASAG